MTSVMDEGTSKYSGVKIREIKKLNGIKINITSQSKSMVHFR